jgi:hypothetical protein
MRNNASNSGQHQQPQQQQQQQQSHMPMQTYQDQRNDYYDISMSPERLFLTLDYR